MEYPDKEEEPHEYIEGRLNKIGKKTWIPDQEKDLACEVGNEVHDIINYSDNFEIHDAYDQMFRAFDLICDLFLKRKDNRDKIPTIRALKEYCDGINERISEINSLTEELKREVDGLEAKIVSEEIISKMKSNPKP